MKHIKLLKSLIIVAPVLALVSPLIILSNTGCGNPTPEPEIRYLPDGTDWVGWTGGTLNFDVDDNDHTYRITGYNDFTADSTFTIPHIVAIDGVDYLVASIKSSAFSGCTGITEINFGWVTSIGSTAFSECTGLTNVDLSGVTSIGNNAFLGCPLEEIHVDSGNSIYRFVGTDSHNGFIQKINDIVSLSPVCGTSGGIACGNIDIPEGVTTISNYAFYGCAELTGVDLTGVTTLGNNSFRYCTGLTNVDLHSVTSIGTTTFEGCTGLIEADLTSVTNLGNNWNMNCSNLSSIIIGSQTYNVSHANPDGWANVGPATGCILHAPSQDAANTFKENIIFPDYSAKWAVQLI